MPKKKDISNDLQKQLLPINLGRVMRPFPNNSDSIFLQRERIFTSGKHLRQLSIFPGVHPKVRPYNAERICKKSLICKLFFYEKILTNN